MSKPYPQLKPKPDSNILHTHILTHQALPLLPIKTNICSSHLANTIVYLIQLCPQQYLLIQLSFSISLSCPHPILTLLSCSQMASSTSLPVHYVDNPGMPYIPSRSNGGRNHTLWQSEPMPVHHGGGEGTQSVWLNVSMCVWCVCVFVQWSVAEVSIASL